MDRAAKEPKSAPKPSKGARPAPDMAEVPANRVWQTQALGLSENPSRRTADSATTLRSASVQARRAGPSPRRSGPNLRNPEEKAAETVADAVVRGKSGPVSATPPPDPKDGPSPSKPSALTGLSGAGAPLAPGLRHRIEQVSGGDLSKARIHANAPSASAANSLGARAFTYGRDIYLGAGESAHDPGLVSHEAAHVLQQTRPGGSARVQRYDDKEVLPAAQNVTWGPDRFQLSFKRHDKKTLHITVTYLGPHSLWKDAGVFEVGITETNLNANLRLSQVGNEAILDLYGDGRKIVRLQDDIEFRNWKPPARSHNFTLRVSGEFRIASTLTVTDPKAHTSQTEPFKGEFLPGTHPEVFHDSPNPATGRMEVKINLDGDGDRMPELMMMAETDAFMSWAGSMASSEDVDITLSQINNLTAKPQTYKFVVTNPDARGSGIPKGADQLNFPGKGGGFGRSLALKVKQVSDGLNPIKIDMTQPSSGQILRLFPPTHSDTETTYTLTLGKTSVNYTFPRERGLLNDVLAPGRRQTLGRVRFWDTKVSRYGDRLRLAIDPGVPSQETLFSAIPLGPNGKPYGGQGVRLKQSVANINHVKLVEDGQTRLAFDLNDDKTPDLFLHDRLEVEPGVSPEEERRHVITLNGPAVGKGLEHVLRFRAVSYGMFNDYRKQYAEDSRAYGVGQATFALETSTATGGLAGQRLRMEGLVSGWRKRAFDEGWISKKLFEAWRLAEAEMIVVQSQRQNQVDPKVAKRAAAAVETFYAAIQREAPKDKKMSGAYTWSNVYTGDSVTYSQVGNIEGEGWGHLTARYLRAGNYSFAFNFWRMTRDGLDKLIAKKAEGSGLSKRDLNQFKAVSAMAAELDKLADRGATRVHAVYRPHSKFSKEPGFQHTVPLEMYYWRENGRYRMVDLTNPTRPFYDSVPDKGTEFKSVLALMGKLNDEDHFAEGHIYYDIPGLITGQVPVEDRVTWRDFLTWIGIGLAIVGTVLSFGTGAVAVAGTWALVGSAVAGATAAAINIAVNAQHGTTTGTQFALDLLQIVTAVASVGAMAAGRVLFNARKMAAAGTPMTGPRWTMLAGMSQKAVIPLAATNLAGDAVSLAVMSYAAAKQLDDIEAGGGTPEQKKQAKMRLLQQLALTGGLTALSLRGNVAEIKMGRSIEIINVRGEPVVVPTGTSVMGRGVNTSAKALDEAADDASRAAARTKLLEDMRGRIEGPGGKALADTEELAIKGRSGAAGDVTTVGPGGALSRGGVNVGKLDDLVNKVHRGNNAARAHGLDFEYVIEFRSLPDGTQQATVTRQQRKPGGMTTDPRRLFVDIDARAGAQAKQLERLRAAARKSDATFRLDPDGGIAINNQINIHPAALDGIDAADLPALLSSTRALEKAGGDRAALEASDPVAALRIKKFESGSPSAAKGTGGRPSKGYRLQFHVTHVSTLAELDSVLSQLGIKRSEVPAFQNLSLRDLDRLNTFRTIGMPKGSSHFKTQATEFAISQNPTTAGQFVEYFEFYIAEVNRKITLNIATEAKRLADATPPGKKPPGPDKKLINRNLEKELGDASDPARPSASAAKDMQARFAHIKGQIGGRIGVQQISPNLPKGADTVAAIRALPDVRFASETAATYHTNKHHRELPTARQTVPEFDAYHRAIQDTVQNAPTVTHSALQRGGIVSYSFKYPDGGATMTAYVFVDGDGRVFLATLIPKG